MRVCVFVCVCVHVYASVCVCTCVCVRADGGKEKLRMGRPSHVFVTACYSRNVFHMSIMTIN